MQKYDVSKFIMSNLINDFSATENKLTKRILISSIVDGWNHDIYFQPKEKVRVNHNIPKNYEFM